MNIFANELLNKAKTVSGGGKDLSSGESALKGVLEPVVNAFIFVIGAVAVIMVIIGAFRYVVSGGDSQATKGAKDTILYALVGLAVAIAAYAVVNYVIGKL